MKILITFSLLAIAVACSREDSIKRYEEHWNSQERMEERNNNSSLIIEAGEPTASDGQDIPEGRTPIERDALEDTDD